MDLQAFICLVIYIFVGTGFVCCSPAPPHNSNNKPQRNLAEERNKKIVVDFYQSLFGDKNLNAIDRYIDDRTYIQHSPNIADGRESFRAAAASTFSANGNRRERVDIRRIVADKDLVWLHVKSGNTAVVDIFRLNNRGKIVEHWDVIQQIPNQAANTHPMF